MQKVKAAVVVEPGKLEIKDVPEPEITDYQAKCRNMCCGICAGTDTKLLNGTFRGVHLYPGVLGHEAIGEVIEVGNKVEKYKVGDRVMRPGLFAQLSDGTHPIFGGLAEYTVAADYEAMVRDNIGPIDVTFISMQTIPEWMEAKHAVLLILFKEVLNGFSRFRIRPNTDMAIFGAGAVGVTFVRLAKLFGVKRVAIVSRTPAKLERAKEMGADLVVNSRESDPVKVLRDFIGEGYDYVIDAAGSPEIIQAGLGLVKMNGTICVYGVSDIFKMNIDWTSAPDNWTLQFHNDPVWPEEALTHDQACNMVKTGILKPEWYLDTVLPFEQTQKAFDLLWAGQAFKAVVEF